MLLASGVADFGFKSRELSRIAQFSRTFLQLGQGLLPFGQRHLLLAALVVDVAEMFVDHRDCGLFSCTRQVLLGFVEASQLEVSPPQTVPKAGNVWSGIDRALD